MVLSAFAPGFGPAPRSFPTPFEGEVFKPGIVGSRKLQKDHSLSFFDGISSARKLVKPNCLAVKNGSPVVQFNKEEVTALAAPFAYTLIGKFSTTVPHIAMVAPTLKSLSLKGTFNVSFIASGLLCLRLLLEEDYLAIRLKGSLFIADCYMTLLDWSPSVDYDVDSPLVPVWLTLKNVPFIFFQRDALFKIVNLLGKPIRVDDATANMSRLDKVRVCVELDVSKPLVDAFYLLYIGIECEVKVCYDCVPVFCGLCCKLGHEKLSCLSAPKEKCGVVPSHLDSSGSQDSVVTSLTDHSGSMDLTVEKEIGVSRGSMDVAVEQEIGVSRGFVDIPLNLIDNEVEDFSLRFENYFDPEPGDSSVCKDSDDLLLMAIGENSLKKIEFEDSFGKCFIYPKPLVVDYSSRVPEFEPCVLKHKRRKSEGSFPSFGDRFVSFGSRDDSQWSDHEDCFLPCFSTYDTYD